MRKLTLVVALLVVCSAARAVAAAETDPKKAFEAATAEFNLGHYTKAASMYEDIYRVTLEPVLLYNIAQAHRLGGDLEKAVFFYKGYLRAQPQAKNREEVKRRIAELEQAIEAKRRSQERPPNAPANVETQGNAAAAATTEPQPAPTAPSEPPPATPPPAPTETPPATTTATEPAPATAQATTTSEAPPERTPVWKKWWFWTIIGGVVVAGVVVGVVVAETSSAPSFGANLPESGPAAHALTAASRTPATGTLLEVRF